MRYRCCLVDSLDVLVKIHPRLACLEQTWDWFSRLRLALANGEWDVPPRENGLPAPALYLALLTYHLTRPEVESLAGRLKIFRDDLNLLRQVLDLRAREEDLDQPVLSNQEIYALLRYATTPAILVFWLCTNSERVRERLWRYEQQLRHIRPTVDGDYLKSLGLKPSPLFSKLLNAVRDARLDGLVSTEAEEKALISRLLAEHDQPRAQ
jgi:hypothetical protein